MNDRDEKKLKKYDTRVDGVYSQIIETGYAKLTDKFSKDVNAVSALIEVNILSAFVLRLTRLAIGCKVQIDKGLDEESLLHQRSAFEVFVNLCYIFHSSKHEPNEKSTKELCTQFSAYGDVAYLKLIKQDIDRARGTFERRRGMTRNEWDSFYSELEKKAAEAKLLGCTSKGWHKFNLKEMALKVEKHPPSYFDKQLHGSLIYCLVSSNSAVHSDALSIRSQYAELKTDLMTLKFSEGSIRSDAVAIIATGGWLALGQYFNNEKWVRKLIDSELKHYVRPRFDAAVEKRERLVQPAKWEDVFALDLFS